MWRCGGRNRWFRANEFNFPLVARAVRALYAVPGAEVDVEQWFSNGRDLLAQRRQQMSGDTMRMCQLLKSYFDRIDAEFEAEAKRALARHQKTAGVSTRWECPHLEPMLIIF
jgi:hypothetical protein